MSQVSLQDVKAALGITGDWQDETIQVYMEEVLGYIQEAGVKEENVTPGVVARGVTDLWNYGNGSGKLSAYFMQRVGQLKYKK